ncbi:unnamed protein product [Symbiodinium natans]|uniref:Uncharacterized protein n=1 Tax=Symbiodinium natans TaxID=878477 RepID=A0A812J4K7_9DINO|nr:unnamed protein product [Symbiodinium natans]
MVLVEGRRLVDEVGKELTTKLLAYPAVDIWAAGRQGAAIALQALARRPKAVRFTISQASGEELDAAGLQPAGEGPIEPSARVGIRLKIDCAEEPGALPEPVKVFQVSQRSNSDFIPLAKAVATELRWMPAGEVLAVESLLLGKAKNVHTRAYNMARAVALASDWQVKPEATGALRPFRCVAQERAVDMQVDDAPAGPEGRQFAEPKALRLVLLADGHTVAIICSKNPAKNN